MFFIRPNDFISLDSWLFYGNKHALILIRSFPMWALTGVVGIVCVCMGGWGGWGC